MDLIWLPAAWVVVPPWRRFIALVYIISCMVIMRLQVEFAFVMGFPHGITGWIDWPLFLRGFLIYGLSYAVYMAYLVQAKEQENVILMAMGLTLFFIILVLSTVFMVI